MSNRTLEHRTDGTAMRATPASTRGFERVPAWSSGAATKSGNNHECTPIHTNKDRREKRRFGKIVVRTPIPIPVPALALLAVLVAHTATASRMPSPPENPRTWVSPSGEFSVHIVPSDPSGRGPAEYAVKKGDLGVWSGQREFTLLGGGITDRGEVFGYGYTYGVEGWSAVRGDPSKGDLIVTIFNPDGSTRHSESHPREWSRFEDGDPDPKVINPILVDLENDRFILRVADPDLNRGSESWWTYRISTGATEPRFEPRSLLPDPSPGLRVCAARPVGGTPLILIHWIEHNPAGSGARFTLVNREGRCVWSTHLPADYAAGDDREAGRNIVREIWKTGAICRCDTPRRFAIRFVKAGFRVEYEAKPKSFGEWNVAEVARTAYEPEPAPTPRGGDADAGAVKKTAPLATDFPEVTLSFLGVVPLRPGERASADADSTGGARSAAPTDSPFRNLLDFTFDDHGNVAILTRRDADTSATVRLVSSADEVLDEIPLSADKTPAERIVSCGGSRFILVGSRGSRPAQLVVSRIDFETGALVVLPQIDASRVEGVDAFPDGRFVILATKDIPNSMRSLLFGLDADGRVLWTVEEGQPRDETRLFATQDVAVTTSGEVAVLSGIRPRIQIFSHDGAFLKSIDLQAAWGREPRYVTRIVRDIDDGYLVEDFFTFQRLYSDGTIRSAFAAAYGDGLAIRNLRARRAPDGQYWTADGACLIPFDDAGRAIADGIRGPMPPREQLGDCELLTVDPFGHIYAVDRRTQAIYILDVEGHSLAVMRPSPDQLADQWPPKISLAFEEPAWPPPIAVSLDGEVAPPDAAAPQSASRPNPFGARLAGFMRIKMDEYIMKDVFQFAGQPWWKAGYKEIALLDDAGAAVGAVRKSPDGNWLAPVNGIRTTREGTVAVLVPRDTAGARTSPSGSSAAVHLYSAKGEPIRSLAVPDECGFVPRFDFDGKRVALCGEKAGFVMDANGAPLMRFALDPGHAYARPFLQRDGKELWLFSGDKEKQLRRYALPSR